MKKSIILTAVATLTAMPLVSTINAAPIAQAVVQNQQQSAQLVALGGSLDENAANQTLQLLGASQVNTSNIIRVDGATINRYLNDGSNAGTVVYSSAYIQEMPAGYGVQVQIMTPQNITQVSATTYQNAAITAGASNALIRIATVSPVTGEGALAGVYALLEAQGVQVSQQDVQVAQQEISLVSEIQQRTGATDATANDALSEVKQEVAKTIQDSEGANTDQASGVENNTIVSNSNQITGDNNSVSNETNIDNSTEIVNIVNNVTNNYGITDEELIQEIIQYAQEFAQTEAAQNVETINQLETSIQANWADTLPTLQGASAEELQAQEVKDYSDSNMYHALIPAIQSELVNRMNTGEGVVDLYADTFIFEAMTPNMSAETRTALNSLRAIMAQYSEGLIPGTIEAWMSQLANFNSLDLTMQEIQLSVAIATGRAPQVYTYMNPTQEGTVVSFEVVYNGEGHTSDMLLVSYDLADGSVVAMDQVTGQDQEVTNVNYLQDKYGVTVENNFLASSISPEYTIPGYTSEEETEEEEEETTVTTTSTVEEEPVTQESVQEPAVEEAPLQEPALEAGEPGQAESVEPAPGEGAQ